MRGLVGVEGGGRYRDAGYPLFPPRPVPNPSPGLPRDPQPPHAPRPCSVKITPSPGQETLQESFLKENEGDLLILA